MNRRPVIGPSSPPPEAEPPSAVVPQPVSTSPAATAPTVSFRREAVRIVSSCVSGGFPPFDRKDGQPRVARVTLACAMSFVVVVSTVRAGGAVRAGLARVPTHRRQEKHVTRRLSLAGQLLALQVVIICVVLVGVTAVTVAQSTQRRPGVRGPAGAGGRRDAGRTPRALRDAVDDGGGRLRPRRGRDHAQQLGLRVGGGGARRPHRHRQRRPRASSASRYDVGDSTVLDGRGLGRGAAVRRQPGRGRDGADPDRPAATRSPGFVVGHAALPVASWTGWRRPPRTC